MAEVDLSRVQDVDIDPDGVFKYVLIRVTPAGSESGKEIVRGFAWAEYHADIYDKVTAELEKQGFHCECLGGGRISHQSGARKIHVYGHSVVRMGPLSAFGGNRLWCGAGLGESVDSRTGVTGFADGPLVPASGEREASLCVATAAVNLLQGFGPAKHSVSTEKLKARYPDYEVTWADEGY
ncbi:hypothetical protein lerEdw1_015838 [Lerista edwardsae]|nr:hypothetical protein lerEdw1_015838 [Lerista edwardsae]